MPASEQEEIDLDYRGLDCPACGCNDIEVLKPPRPGRWWGSGRARCNDCGVQFRLVIDQADEDNAPQIHQRGIR